MKPEIFKEFVRTAKKVKNLTKLPILDYVSIHNGIATYGNLEIFVQFVHEDLNSYCHSFISLDKLDSIVGNKKMNEKDLQFESNKEGVNVKIGELLWSDKNDCLYDKEGVSQYPECPSALNEEYSFANLDSIPMQDISLVIKASMYATNNELHEYSQCVMVDTENIVATDPYWMFYKKSHKREDSILIPLSVIPILDEKSEYEVYYCTDKKWYSLVDRNGIVLSFKEMEFKYPNWQTVIHKEVNATLSFNLSDLQDYTSLLKKDIDKYTLLFIDTKSNTASFFKNEDDFASLKVNMSIEGGVTNLGVGVNFNRFMQIVKSEGVQGEISLGIVDAHSALHFNNSVLLMPAHLKDKSYTEYVK